MLCIVFYLNLRSKYVVKYLFLFFLSILVGIRNIKKLCGYLHNGYSTNINMNMRRIFIQRIGYKGTTTVLYSHL